MEFQEILQTFTDIVSDDGLDLLRGVWMTVVLTVTSVVIGFCLAIPLSLMRLSSNKFVWMPVYGYIFYFRGTPLLIQIFLIYYGSGQFRDVLESVGLWTYFRAPFFCAVLALTLNTTAYTAELFRGAIQAVPKQEVEAAMSLGLSKLLAYRLVILPRAFRLALPAYTNEVVFLLQATSLVSIITIMDITGVARVITARGFAFYEVYLMAAVLYLVLVYALLFMFGKLENYLAGHLKPKRSIFDGGMKVHGNGP